MHNISEDSSLKRALGPLWHLFVDPTVYTICVDSFNEVYYYQNNEAKPLPDAFESSGNLEAMVEKLINHSGKVITPELKSLSISLDEYTRVNFVFPPVSVKGTSILINKLPKQEVTLSDLVKYGALEDDGRKIIENAIELGCGILIAGNPGSGKITLLNTLIESIPQPRRVITVERYSDLIIKRPKVCRLQTQYQTAAEMVELVNLAERLFPEYLVLPECYGPEVMPYLELVRNNCSGMALITGENSLDALKRLETKAVLSSEGMSLEDARYAISQSFELVIFQEKRKNGKRLVSSIAEIVYDSGELKLKVLYKK